MNITFIGGGNMAGAIIGGLKAKGLATSGIRIAEPHAAARERVEVRGPRLGRAVAAEVWTQIIGGDEEDVGTARLRGRNPD